MEEEQRPIAPKVSARGKKGKVWAKLAEGPVENRSGIGEK
jgi:hypothetical protein